MEGAFFYIDRGEVIPNQYNKCSPPPPLKRSKELLWVGFDFFSVMMVWFQKSSLLISHEVGAYARVFLEHIQEQS